MLTKNEQFSFSKHMNPKLFITFLIYFYQFRKNKSIFTDTFESIDKENM